MQPPAGRPRAELTDPVGLAADGPGVQPHEGVARALARQERWEELAALHIERAEAAPDPAERAAELVRAALVFEAKLADNDKACLILQAAFQEEPRSEEARRELARVAGALGRWGEILIEMEAGAVNVEPPHKRVSLLVAVGRWHEERGDEGAAERTYLSALDHAPAHPSAVQALCDLYERRGDWGRMAFHLARASAAAQRPAEALRLALEAAVIYHTRLDDRAHAAEQYGRVLEVDAGNLQALEALADITCARGDWSAALPLLDALVPLFDGRSRPDRARLHQRRAHAAEETGDASRARDSYRRAHELAPDDLALVVRWVDLAVAQAWWDDVRPLCEWLLARRPGEVAPAVRADSCERLGRAFLVGGDAPRALAAFRRGLEIDPEHRACREGAVDAAKRAGDAGALVEHQRALLSGVADEDDRADALAALARNLRDELRDGEGALKAFSEAHALRPDHGVMHEMLDLLTATKQWKRAVQLLQQLAAAESGPAKARYLVAGANIMNYELHAVDEAVELYNEALDADPEDLKSFERIDKLLTAKRAWRDEARNYRRMIKRLGNDPTAEKRGTLVALWRGLGEIYRTRLKDLPAAAAAYEVCASLAPGDDTVQEILAEIFELQGAAGLAQAVERRTRLLESARDNEGAVRHLRVLRKLYFEHRHWDRVWCVCAALVALDSADAKEREFYDRYSGPGVPLARAGITDEIWHRALYHPREDRRVSQIFAAVSAAVAQVRAKEARAWGLDDRRRIDVESDPSPVAQILLYASRVLGIGRPALYVHADVPGEIDLANVVAHNQLIPSFVVGADLLHGRTEKEVAFVLAKKLALLRLDHLVLWPHVVPTRSELKVILVAVLKIFHPSLDVSGIDASALKQYLALFQRTLAPQVLEPLMAAVPALVQQGASVDVGIWCEAVENTADRAGLLVCGDIVAATRVVARETAARGGSTEAAIRSLVHWSVSKDYLELRQQLGMALGEGAAAPSHPGGR